MLKARQNYVHQILHICIALYFMLAGSLAYAQDTAKPVISGSTTVTNFVMAPNADQIREKSGIDYELLTNSSGRGLKSLAEGSSDIAMISADIENLIAKLNKNDDTALDVKDFNIHPLSALETEFIAHESNDISTLTKDQLKDIFTGRIKNWSELGIDTLEDIKIVTEHPTGGIYQTIVNNMLNGTPITEERITMQNAPQVALVVSQLPNSFGFLSAATPKDQRKNIKTIQVQDLNLQQNLYLVTKANENRPAILKLVETITNLSGDIKQ